MGRPKIYIDKKSLNKVMNNVNRKIANDAQQVIEKKVVPYTKQVMSEHVQKDVYNVYSPKYYVRRANAGGLIDERNIVSNVSRDSFTNLVFFKIELENNTPFNAETSIKDSLAVFINNGVSSSSEPYLQPRPFLEEANVEIKLNAQKIFKSGMALKGYKV